MPSINTIYIYKVNKCRFLLHKIYRPSHLEQLYQKVDQERGSKWLIHGTAHCKDNLSPTELCLTSRTPTWSYNLYSVSEPALRNIE